MSACLGAYVPMCLCAYVALSLASQRAGRHRHPDTQAPRHLSDPWLWALAALLLAAGAGLLQAGAGPPQGHHAWAMADYYAMALNFVDHNLDIFHPRTYNLMTREGITASDFPLPAWLAALVMKISRSGSPVIFRSLTWLVSMAGMLFFYGTLRSCGLSGRRALVLSLLFWSFPTLLYYNNGFMPSVWAFAAFLAGVRGLAGFEKNGRSQAWALAVAGLTLAALIRKPFALHFATWALFLLLRKSPRRHWAYLGAGMLAVGVWQAWSLYLDRTYGSLFLNHLMSPRSFGEGLELTMRVWSKWLWAWFTPGQLFWLVGLLAWVSFSRRKTSDGRPWGILSAFALGLAAAYFVLMLRQYPDHEYYFIDSFYPAVFLLGIYLARRTRTVPGLVWVETFLLVIALWFAWHRYREYRKLDSYAIQETTSRAYEQGGALLERLEVPPEGRILALEAYSFNRPFLGLRRKGYTSLSSQKENQEALLANRPDYLACPESSFVSEVVNDFPEIVQRLEPVGRSEDLLLFRPGNFPENTLETLLAVQWETLTDTAGLRTADEFLFTRTTRPNNGRSVLFYGRVQSDRSVELKATVALMSGDSTLEIFEKPLRIRQAGQTIFCSTQIPLPDSGKPYDALKIYLWNPERTALEFEQFRISIFE
jgi:hypothetical protein